MADNLIGDLGLAPSTFRVQGEYATYLHLSPLCSAPMTEEGQAAVTAFRIFLNPYLTVVHKSLKSDCPACTLSIRTTSKQLNSAIAANLKSLVTNVNI